jgi:hypothetical protein
MYDKTEWEDDVTPVSETIMNNIENGIEAAFKGTHIYAASTEGNDTYVISFSTALASYNAGLVFNVKVDVGNTGAATINVDGVGSKDIKKIISTGKSALVTGDLIANGIYTLVYDGTDFIVINPNVPIGYEKIYETTLGADVSSITFSDLGLDSYKSIRILAQIKTTYTTSDTILYMLFNGDTGNNYCYDSTPNQSRFQFGGNSMADGDDEDNFFTIDIWNRISSKYKQVVHRGVTGAATPVILNGAGSWKNKTDLITSITFLCENGNIKSGSAFTILGVR